MVPNQGYVAVNQNNDLYPSIGVTPGGKGVMTFSLTGQDYYPSAAYARLAKSGATNGPVHIAAAGTKPDDGFTGYHVYGGTGTGRWGEYSAAVATPGGSVWLAAEYIPGTFGYPAYLANWGTAIANVTP